MIEIQSLTKRYGDKVAVDDLTCNIQEGGVLGFLGRNGAGKTTTMNMITGYISSTSGTVRVDGNEILEEPREVKRLIGYLPEQPPLYMDMTVREYLQFVCDIKDVNHAHRRAHINDVCDLIRIGDVSGRLIKNLSKGYRQRVGMAQALINNPPYIILDEPTVGLDPKQIIEIRRLIKDLGKNHTVVLSSHILHEVSDVCERVIIIDRGKIVAQDTLENLMNARNETSNLILRVPGDGKKEQKAIRALDGVTQVEWMGSHEANTSDLQIETMRDQDVRTAIFHLLARIDSPILLLRRMDVTLEDIFLQLTSEKEAG